MAETQTIALAGNPNSGKTTLFNTLTGSRQQVGNYPGITVDKREGFVDHQGKTVHIVDLPGTYSLTAYSQEELVARKFLVEEEPEVVVDVVDATNLERNLYLAVQFLELGVPVVLALNMMDEVKKRGMTVDSQRLGQLMHTPVVPIVARMGQGKSELLSTILETAEQHRHQSWEPLRISYGPDLDPKLEVMSELIEERGFLTTRYPARWTALKYLEEDPEIMSLGHRVDSQLASTLEGHVAEVARHCKKTLDTHPEAIIADYRYGFITSLLRQDIIARPIDQSRINFSDKADQLLTHRLLGPLIMFGVLYAMFYLTFGLGQAPLEWVQAAFSWLGSLTKQVLPPGLLRSLIVSGIIDGVGGVLSFVPLILIMFFGLSFLEDSGYMARMAYMLDRVLRTFGLHGCSVMPFIISGGIPGGCAVPGIMATRTLRSPKEKLATLLTAPFLSCGAKVPVFLLIAGAFFPGSAATVLFWLTICGWAAALLTARLLRSTIIRGEPTPFVMELPPYRLPTVRGLLIHTWERGWQYIRKAGTIILAISILLWAAMTFPGLPEEAEQRFDSRIQSLQAQLHQTESLEAKQELRAQLQGVRKQRARTELKSTMAGRIGTALEPVTRLAGFDWKINISLIGGVAAKEVIVSSLGTAYSLGEIDQESSASISDRLKKDPSWNKITGLSLMVFVLLYAPCFVSIVTMAKESSWKWAGFSIIFNTILAYAVAVAIYQVGHNLV
jgi:ferrous iron transport protein B